MAGALSVAVTTKNDDGKVHDLPKHEFVHKLVEASVFSTAPGNSGETRQKPSCLVRLMNVLSHDSTVEQFMTSRAQASYVKLDNDEIGAKNQFGSTFTKLLLKALEKRKIKM
jgi:hypothetical protein